jgi:hypothetical protein
MPIYPLEADEKIKNYFDTLPPYLKENILQSGNIPGSVEELQDHVKEILKEQDE